MIVTVVAGIIMGVLAMPAPIAGSALEGSGFGTALLLGFAVATAAPIGDLAESQLKRDIGIKDMGSFLPGHGGMMDRLDSLIPNAFASWAIFTVFLGASFTGAAL